MIVKFRGDYPGRDTYYYDISLTTYSIQRSFWSGQLLIVVFLIFPELS